MKCIFTCKKVPLNDSIKSYAERRMEKLDRYFKEEAEAFLVFGVEKGNRCTVELTVRDSSGTLYRAQAENEDGDMRGTIDEAVDCMIRRIRKNKTRLAKHLKDEVFVPEVPAEFDVSEETDFEIVRKKQMFVKPMSAEEAILQMNLLHHDFFLYRDVEDSGLKVVYRRKSGGYGLLEAAQE